MKVTIKDFQSLTGLSRPYANAVLNFLAAAGLAVISKERVNGRMTSVYTLADAVQMSKVSNG